MWYEVRRSIRPPFDRWAIPGQTFALPGRPPRQTTSRTACQPAFHRETRALGGLSMPQTVLAPCLAHPHCPGIAVDLLTYGTLVRALAQEGQWQQAVRLYDGLGVERAPNPEAARLNALIAGYPRSVQWQEALKLFRRKEPRHPSRRTYGGVLSTLMKSVWLRMCVDTGSAGMGPRSPANGGKGGQGCGEGVSGRRLEGPGKTVRRLLSVLGRWGGRLGRADHSGGAGQARRRREGKGVAAAWSALGHCSHALTLRAPQPHGVGLGGFRPSLGSVQDRRRTRGTGRPYTVQHF